MWGWSILLIGYDFLFLFSFSSENQVALHTLLFFLFPDPNKICVRQRNKVYFYKLKEALRL